MFNFLDMYKSLFYKRFNDIILGNVFTLFCKVFKDFYSTDYKCFFKTRILHLYFTRDIFIFIIQEISASIFLQGISTFLFYKRFLNLYFRRDFHIFILQKISISLFQKSNYTSLFYDLYFIILGKISTSLFYK